MRMSGSSKSRISALQLGSALFISRLFSEAMSFPLEVSEYTMSRFTAVFAAKLLLFAACLPPLFIARKYPGENVVSAALKKCPALAWIEGLFITAVLFLSFSVTLSKLDYYATSTIFSKAPTLLLIAVITLVCGYGIWKGVETVVRVASAVTALFLVFVAAVIISVSGRFNFDYFYPVLIENGKTFFSQMGSELAKNPEILVFAALMGYVREKPQRTVVLSVPAVLIVIELLIFAETAVFGPYLSKLNFPFYVLSALSGMVLFQRLDGIDVVIWILSCVIKLSLYGICVRTIFGNLVNRRAGAIAAGIFTALGAGLAFFLSQNREAITLLNASGVNMLLLFVGGTLVPLIILLIKPKKTHSEKEKNNEKIKTP